MSRRKRAPGRESQPLIRLPTVKVTMAKHRKQTRVRGYGLVPIRWQISLALGALVNDVAVALVTVDSLAQNFDIISTEFEAAYRGHTAGEGPMDIGLAADQYSVAEIVEALDASPLSQYGTAMERSRRRVRRYGQFSGLNTEEEMSDEGPVRRKMFLRAQGGSDTGMAKVYVVNRSNANLTTGTVVEITGTHWGRWK